MIVADERLSRLPVGSSASTIAGLPTSARAIATRWRSPPESSVARWLTRFGESHPIERRSCLLVALPARAACVQQTVGHVVECGVSAEQEELLEHEPDRMGPQGRQLAIG